MKIYVLAVIIREWVGSRISKDFLALPLGNHLEALYKCLGEVVWDIRRGMSNMIRTKASTRIIGSN